MISLNDTQLEIPLLTLWDYFGSYNSGMSQYFRGLQGDGSQLKFKQLIYKSKRGAHLSYSKEIIFKINNVVNSRIVNKDIFLQISGKPWVLGGQQFVHLIEEKFLRTSIGVIFDLLDLDYPDWDFTGHSSNLIKKKVQRIEWLNRIVTISQYSKQRILAHFDLDPDKISVIYPGVDKNRFRKLENKDFRTCFGLPEDAIIILYIGSEHRRKNLLPLVQGLGKLVQSFPQVIFIKIGQPQSTHGRFKFTAALDKHNLLNNFKIIDYVTDEDLSKWYSIADIFTFPSIGEGFGIPLLEAMSCGIPIVTTRCSSIPEVIGDAAIFIIDPFSYKEWGDSLAGLIANPEKRHALSKRGQEQALKFSWESARNKFIDLLSHD